MFCKRCGSPIADNARFCPICGTAVGAEPQQPAAQAGSQPMQQSAPQAAAQPMPQQPGQTSQQRAAAQTQEGMPGGYASPAPQPFAGQAAPAPAPQPLTVQQDAPRHKLGKKPLAALIVALVVVLGVGGGALFYFTQLAPVSIDEKNFPDAGLRAIVSTSFDTDRDGKLSRDEARAATKIDLSGVASTQGLGKALPSLAVVEGGDGKLSHLDLSGCGKLQKVSLDGASNIKSVDLDGCDDLTELSLAGAGGLKQVDLSGKKKLAKLSLSQNTDTKGISDTQLDELWLPVSYESTDRTGVYGDRLDIDRDDDGYVTSHELTPKQGSGQQVEVEHDGNGQISKMSKSNGGVLASVYTFSRDESGKITSIDDDESVGDFSGTITYEYDADGRLTGIKQPTGYGTVGGSFAYQGGNMVTDTELSAGNPHTIVYSYAYDRSGNVTSYTKDFQGDTVGTRWTLTLGYDYNGDGKISRVTPKAYDTHGNDYGSLSDYAAVDYVYDGTGRLSKVQSERGGAYAEFRYDDHDNLNEIDEYDSDGDPEYTFEMTFQRYFCSKGAKNKPEQWVTMGSRYDADRGSWNTSSANGTSNFARAYLIDPLDSRPEPFRGSRYGLD